MQRASLVWLCVAQSCYFPFTLHFIFSLGLPKNSLIYISSLYLRSILNTTLYTYATG